MSLDQNLKMGEKAVKFVNGIITGASNQLSDRLASMGGVEKLVDLWRNADPAERSDPALGFKSPVESQVDLMRNRTRDALKRDHSLFWLDETARQAIKARRGNCGEQAAIAYLWLYHKGVRPIDYMEFATKKEKMAANAGKENPPYLDHAFVVIGRKSDSDLCNLRSWGDEAVWCDPWQLREGRVFAISEFIKGNVRNLDWQYRLDSVGRVEEGMPMCRVRDT